MNPVKTYDELLRENQELQFQLEEANDTINAIRTGQVDALVVKDEAGHQLYTLKSADQTYRVFIEQMAEGAVTLNEDGIILYSNSRFATMMGLPLEKMIGLKLDTFVHDVSKDEFDTLIGKGWLADHKDEVILNNVNRESKPYLLSCSTLELDEGTALSIILTDLSVQKENQYQLKLKNDLLEDARSHTQKLNNELEATVRERTKDLYASKEHFKFLADNIPQMAWTNLPTGEVNFYNQQWYKYTGLTFEQIKDWNWHAVVHAEDINETTEKYIHSLQTGKIFEVENRYKRSDGIYRWHLNRGVPLRNDAGEITLWVGTATDIEDQKRAMEKKDEFIGIASHELKTPLTSLKGYLQIIGTYKKEPLPEAIKPYINKANVAANKLHFLVNDLLDVSKINAGKLEYHIAPINMSELIAACLESANHVYPTHYFISNIELGLMVNGNAERLEQVIMNFVSNAVKYAQRNKKIVISVEKKGSNVRTAVTDFGIGLSETQKEKIFERFYRVEDKKFLTSGLGMGLYICSEIIKAHNGDIGVESEFDKGSTFYFDLPLL